MNKNIIYIAVIIILVIIVIFTKSSLSLGSPLTGTAAYSTPTQASISVTSLPTYTYIINPGSGQTCGYESYDTSNIAACPCSNRYNQYNTLTFSPSYGQTNTATAPNGADLITLTEDTFTFNSTNTYNISLSCVVGKNKGNGNYNLYLIPYLNPNYTTNQAIQQQLSQSLTQVPNSGVSYLQWQITNQTFNVGDKLVFILASDDGCPDTRWADSNSWGNGPAVSSIQFTLTG